MMKLGLLAASLLLASSVASAKTTVTSSVKQGIFAKLEKRSPGTYSLSRIRILDTTTIPNTVKYKIGVRDMKVKFSAGLKKNLGCATGTCRSHTLLFSTPVTTISAFKIISARW